MNMYTMFTKQCYVSARCMPGTYTCVNGRCLSPDRICDGVIDCAHGDDEPSGCGIVHTTTAAAAGTTTTTDTA